MRKTLVALPLIALVLIGYAVWPIYAAAALARAVEARDVGTAMAYVDVASVRASITQQVVDTYLKGSGRSGSPMLRGIAARAASSIADPIVEKMLASDALIEFLRTGRPSGVPVDDLSGVGAAALLTSANVGSAWQMFASADYGIRRFTIRLPQTLSPSRRFLLEFRLSKWRWRLADVQLPLPLRERLADALAKMLKKR